MQKEITGPLELLKDDGTLTGEGWARKPWWNYDRRKVRASWHRIKEWDYYAVISQDGGYGLTVTMSDLSFAALVAVCWVDFKAGTYKQLDTIRLMTRGRMGFPPSSKSGDLYFSDKKMTVEFGIRDNKRIISIDAPSFESPYGDRGLKARLVLQQDPDMDSMVIATSWAENRKAFYYNQKINCMPAEGTVTMGTRIFTFSPNSSFGCLDWGRGNWTYKNTWYWGSASGTVNGKSLGWNIGYGFSDRSPASENILFYEGKGHKLNQVTFHFDGNDFMKPWKFTSNDGRFELDFEPALDRESYFNLGLISSIQHQVFGWYTGTVTLDNGTVIALERFPGFAEEVRNRW